MAKWLDRETPSFPFFLVKGGKRNGLCQNSTVTPRDPNGQPPPSPPPPHLPSAGRETVDESEKNSKHLQEDADSCSRWLQDESRECSMSRWTSMQLLLIQQSYWRRIKEIRLINQDIQCIEHLNWAVEANSYHLLNELYEKVESGSQTLILR